MAIRYGLPLVSGCLVYDDYTVLTSGEHKMLKGNAWSSGGGSGDYNGNTTTLFYGPTFPAASAPAGTPLTSLGFKTVPTGDRSIVAFQLDGTNPIAYSVGVSFADQYVWAVTALLENVRRPLAGWGAISSQDYGNVSNIMPIAGMTWYYDYEYVHDTENNADILRVIVVYSSSGNFVDYGSGLTAADGGVVIRININDLAEYLKTLPNLATYGLDGKVTYNEKEYSPAYGEYSEPGGYGTNGQPGTFDDSSDTISIPAMPSFGVTSTGFINVYEVSQGALITFGSELFPDLSFTPISTLPTPTDVVTALENIATVAVDFGNQIPNIIDMYINNTLINYILDCHIIPVSPTTSGTSAIKVGFRTFTPSAGDVTSDYVDFDCGSLNIAEYYANFLDYAPYTSAKLFLPFVGFVDMLPEFWQSGTLNIKYRFNVIDGSFMCFVSATSSKSKLSNTVIAQYGGNACVHLPITGTNYSNMITGLIGAASGVAAGGHAASALMGGAASALNAVATRSGMQSSNSYNSSTSFLGIRTPYLLIERTVADFSASYDTEHGLPSNITAKFSSLSGFTTSNRVHLDGFTGATSAELDEISSLLAGGVIL